MKNFSLDIIYTIPGISAASGLLLHDDSLFLVSDHASCIYEYDLLNGDFYKMALPDIPLSENINKKLKPDFEALTYFNEAFYAFGSGSATNRNLMVRFSLVDRTKISIHDLSKVYNKMKVSADISADELNIEGAVITGDSFYFFQRGNGKLVKNGVFRVKGEITGSDFDISYTNFELPKIGRIPSTFTDATMVGNHIYFLAAAENSQSVYDDGEILGSFIGRINPTTMTLDFVAQISATHKFEGIALLKQRKNEIIFLLCEDNDTAHPEANIYKLSLSL